MRTVLFILCSLDSDKRPGHKRRRGRPVTRYRPPKTRLMSEVTKKKISESSRKFSICKLCDLQCRGFRGLVDHMHRDHQDYKPWQCHICGLRTTFAKTLYRHLKEEHNTKAGRCPVCGKEIRRAQSMMEHFNKARLSKNLLTLQLTPYTANLLTTFQLTPYTNYVINLSAPL